MLFKKKREVVSQCVGFVFFLRLGGAIFMREAVEVGVENGEIGDDVKDNEDFFCYLRPTIRYDAKDPAENMTAEKNIPRKI